MAKRLVEALVGAGIGAFETGCHVDNVLTDRPVAAPVERIARLAEGPPLAAVQPAQRQGPIAQVQPYGSLAADALIDRGAQTLKICARMLSGVAPGPGTPDY